MPMYQVAVQRTEVTTRIIEVEAYRATAAREKVDKMLDPIEDGHYTKVFPDGRNGEVDADYAEVTVVKQARLVGQP